jgi:putative transposase
MDLAHRGRRLLAALESDQRQFLAWHAERHSAHAKQDAQARKGLWQRRYWEHAIRDEADLERHVDYIHYNPVKHGHVSRVRDWPYSSFHRYVANGILPLDWAGEVRGVEGQFGE